MRKETTWHPLRAVPFTSSSTSTTTPCPSSCRPLAISTNFAKRKLKNFSLWIVPSTSEDSHTEAISLKVDFCSLVHFLFAIKSDIDCRFVGPHLMASRDGSSTKIPSTERVQVLKPWARASMSFGSYFRSELRASTSELFEHPSYIVNANYFSPQICIKR